MTLEYDINRFILTNFTVSEENILPSLSLISFLPWTYYIQFIIIFKVCYIVYFSNLIKCDKINSKHNLYFGVVKIIHFQYQITRLPTVGESRVSWTTDFYSYLKSWTRELTPYMGSNNTTLITQSEKLWNRHVVSLFIYYLDIAWPLNFHV